MVSKEHFWKPIAAECRVCGNEIAHLISDCEILTSTLYKDRHDGVAKVI